MVHSGQIKWIAIVAGVVAGLFWHYLNAQIFGYLAIWRFPEHWGAAARMVTPVVLFFVAAVVTCWVLVRCFGRASAAGICASLVSYALGEIYALVVVSHGAPEIFASVLLVCAAALAAVIGVRFARTRNELGSRS